VSGRNGPAEEKLVNTEVRFAHHDNPPIAAHWHNQSGQVLRPACGLRATVARRPLQNHGQPTRRGL